MPGLCYYAQGRAGSFAAKAASGPRVRVGGDKPPPTRSAIQSSKIQEQFASCCFELLPKFINQGGCFNEYYGRTV